uniref:NADH-ubiquinone oxidoreductase chain 2 n=1 Tax=Candida neerlandica TaxID=148634 RepID=B4Y553_9ASCO|nr:NADH dehydrogenase subunit 2 [Candida neerlandica]ABX89443.1 NADH dehydrogenase subunit 2 [Candida neerlandica]
MLLISLVSLIVYLAYNPNTQHYNRLSSISLLFISYLAWECLNLQYTNITLFNDWFKYTPGNSPIVILLLILVLSLLLYTTIINKFITNNKWIALLMIINLIGLVLLPMVNDLIPLYVVIELQSYSLYIITGVYNKSYNATRGAILYFVTGGIASVLILLSSAEVYHETGLTNLNELSTYYLFNSNDTIFNSFNILIIGLIFKMGLAPLHSWSIAVYSYTPTYITAYISIVAKVSIMSFIYINIALFNSQILLLSFYLSIIIAAYMPLYQVTIKSILAYSGILNFGYLITAVVLADQAYYLYILQYSLTHILIFYCILAIGSYSIKPASQWSPIVNVNELILNNNTLIIIFIICLFSLIGIPPLPGFYGKYYIIVALMDSGLYLESLGIIIFSVIATYYYAYIIKQLATNLNNNGDKVLLNSTISLLISIYIVILISLYLILPTLLEGLTLLLN